MNKSKTTWKSHLLFALRTFILIKIMMIAENASAQGRLSAIRNEVRQPQAEEPREERKRPESSHRDHDHSSGHEDHHDRERRRRRRRRNQFIDLDYFSCQTPTQVVHTREIHVVQPPVQIIPPVATTYPQPIDDNYHSVVENDLDWIEDPQIEEVFSSSFRNWGARITGWYGGGVDGISQGNLGVLFQSPGGIGLDGNVRTVREQGFSDHLWLGDLNLVYEPVCNDFFRLRIGAGVNWLADRWGGDAGFNLTSGFDAQLSERVILGGEVDLGNLGASDYLHAQLSLGYQLDSAEIVIGYDHTNIGAVDLNSPFAGLRFRF